MRISVIAACMFGVFAFGSPQFEKAKKALVKESEAAKLMQGVSDDMPTVPWDCFDEQSYYYESGSICDDIWLDWNVWCMGKPEEELCEEVYEAYE